MKKIFLYAYDRVNLGDDLFVKTIADRYPDVKFYLWSKKYNRNTFSMLKNLRVLDQESPFYNFLKKLHPSIMPRYKAWLEKRCNAVVYIGGSIFIEYENWKKIMTWWDYEAQNRNFYVLGANFGPYKTEDYRDKSAEVFRNLSDICFRDKYSKELFKDVENARYAPDILMNCKYPEKVNTEKQIFVSVIDCGSRESGMDRVDHKEADYVDLMARYITDFAKSGYKVVLSSFCTIEKDTVAIEKILNSIIDDSIKAQVAVLEYDGSNSDSVLKAIAESELIIASRFHATVLGFAADKPVLPVVYSDKTLNILRDFGFNGECLDIRKLRQESYFPISKIDYSKQMLSDKDIYAKESEKHFSKLDELLR